MNSLPYKLRDTEYKFYYNDQDGENIFHMSYPKIELANSNSIILDIGGNIGSSAIYFHQLYPNSTIYVFEPDDISYKTLLKNIDPFKNIKSYNIGLFNEDKFLKLHRCPFGSSGNSVYLDPSISYETIDIELKKASSVIVDYKLQNANILKVDTEGCEVPILQDIFSLGLLFDIIYVEYHCDEDRFEIEKMMYLKYKLISANIKCKNIGELTYINNEIKGFECSSMKLPQERK